MMRVTIFAWRGDVASAVMPASAARQAARKARPWTGRPARPSPAKGPGAHTGDMRRIIGTIVGAIVAVSLAITSVGSIVATLKTFLIIGLIAIAVIIIVWLVARRPRRG
jgi:hypothetical protein